MDQKLWNAHVDVYDEEIVSSLAKGVKNPIYSEIRRIPGKKEKRVADLGCGRGDLLPLLSKHFKEVIALDFAEEMLRQASVHAKDNIHFLQQSFLDLSNLKNYLDVAISVNSILMPFIPDIKKVLSNIYKSLKKDGIFLAIVPAMEGVIHEAMMIYEHERKDAQKHEIAVRRMKNSIESNCYNFELGLLEEKGCSQKFYYRFEIINYLEFVGFKKIKIKKVLYPCESNVINFDALKDKPKVWDWFIRSEK